MSNGAILVVFGLLYAGMLILFGWQTYQFLDFLFPNDQMLMKVLTLISFDVLAFLWGATDLFYSFASRGAKAIVKWAWLITFLLSLGASILYLVFQSMFRFKLDVSQDMINAGYTISIVALTYNIVSIMFFLYCEYNARHPHQDDFEWKLSEVGQRRLDENIAAIGERITIQQPQPVALLATGNGASIPTEAAQPEPVQQKKN